MHRRALLATGLAGLAIGCTPTLGMFDALAPRDPGGTRTVRGAAYGAGPRQRLDVYAPANRTGSLPVLVFIYGGSWRSGDKDDYSFLGAAFAAQGFLTVIPDYRLVPQIRFPDFVADCALALRWVQDNAAEHGGDPRRIVLAGHSAGAYNAAMLALDERYLRDAGVAAASIRGMAGLAGPYDFLPFDVDATRDAFGQAPDLALTQPVRFARAEAPPLLLLWGEDDSTVGRRNHESLARLQTGAGGAVEVKTYAGVDHIDILLAISRPLRARAPVLEDVTAFARRVTAQS